MASSPPLLEFDALVAPIPGDNPAGGPVPFDVRGQLEEDRREENPSDYAEDDPMRPEQFKKADWPHIIRLGQETLAQTSKDLLLAARMTEALVKQNGFAGLRDGLRLMRLLVEKCWDRLNPPIESEDDLELRAGPFNWLDDPDRGARFPSTIRGAVVVRGENGAYSWLDWKQSQDGRGPVSRETFDKAVASVPVDQCEAAAQDLAESSAEIAQLTQLLGSKLGAVAPGLTGLRQAVDDCRVLVQQILKVKGSTAGAAGEPAGDGKAAAGAAGARPASSRSEAYRQLKEAALVLQQLEPHSPIPYLVQRAVELGAMPFPDLMKALIREPNVLAELNRELGIKQPPPAAE
jgi:type VI secretion system protein ImpA